MYTGIFQAGGLGATTDTYFEQLESGKYSTYFDVLKTIPGVEHVKFTYKCSFECSRGVGFNYGGQRVDLAKLYKEELSKKYSVLGIEHTEESTTVYVCNEDQKAINLWIRSNGNDYGFGVNDFGSECNKIVTSRSKFWLK